MGAWMTGKSALAAIAGATLCGTPAAAFKDQWKDSEKALSQYISEGFALQQTLIRQVSPFAKYDYVYLLRKDAQLARCIESIVTDRGAVVDTRIVCADLVTPFDR